MSITLFRLIPSILPPSLRPHLFRTESVPGPAGDLQEVPGDPAHLPEGAAGRQGIRRHVHAHPLGGAGV